MTKDKFKRESRKDKLNNMSDIDNRKLQNDINSNDDSKFTKLHGKFAARGLRCRIKAMGGIAYYITVIKNNSIYYIPNYLTSNDIKLVTTLKNARLFKSFEDANTYLEKQNIQFYTRIQSLESK